ncbi:uncharacterized protein LOC111266368 isoform X3 [Varroa jacobsoni]|uniref:uncharacterized protein LOC111266368 isoform X3 n=1 Tax=Varroa jacobsoni TaxID=62625 RepID=UPI000BF5D1AC|nr:uncharacterized protein LOC111266368 isoform X3 [Varroa jacobsoni]
MRFAYLLAWLVGFISCDLVCGKEVTTQKILVETSLKTYLTPVSLRCTFPGSPRHGRIVRHQNGFPDNSTIEFGCDHGYMLLGPKSMRCVGGAWARGVPYCVRDVARDKPAFLKPADPKRTESPVQVAGLALDGNDETCSFTHSTWHPRLWSVALLEEMTVSTLKIVFGTSLKEAQLEVRVGNSHPPALNQICWSDTKDFETKVPHYIKCNEPSTRGRYVSIHLRSVERTPLSLCTVEVHSESGVAPEDACPNLTGEKGDVNNTVVELFHGKCIEFHTAERRVPLNEARNICEDRGGRLVGRGLKRHGLHFLAWRAAKLFGQDPFWLDASSNQGVWTWDDSQDPSMELAREEESVDSRCFAAGPTRTFEPANCAQGLRVVCQFEPLSCGTAPLPKALRDWALFDKLKVGQSLSDIRCEDGFFSSPDDRLVCQKNGTLSGSLRCKPFPCGPPPFVEGSSVHMRPPDSVKYTCISGRLLKGNTLIHCNASSSLWAPAPQCERVLDFLARNVDSVQCAVKERLTNGLEKYRSFPRGTRFGIVAGLLVLVLITTVGIVKCSYRQKAGNKI